MEIFDQFVSTMGTSDHQAAFLVIGALALIILLVVIRDVMYWMIFVVIFVVIYMVYTGFTIDAGGVHGTSGKSTTSSKEVSETADQIKGAWDKFVNDIKAILDKASSAADKVNEATGNVSDTIDDLKELNPAGSSSSLNPQNLENTIKDLKNQIK